MIYPNIEDDDILNAWPSRCPHHLRFNIPQGKTFSGMFDPAANRLGVTSTTLEYYMGIFTSYGESWEKFLPEEYIRALNAIAGSIAPHTVLKIYRIRRGLE